MNTFLKILRVTAGILLGLMFVMSGVIGLFNLVTVPEPIEGSPTAHFMAAMGPTGYMTFIKVLEVIGGVLVAIPRTRNLGLLTLGPIIVNILAYHAFVMDGEGLFQAPIVIIVILAAYLLWVERVAFGGLIRRDRLRTRTASNAGGEL